MNRHDEKLAEQIQRLAAEFVNRQSSGQTFITVTGLRWSDQGRQANVQIGVWPKDKRTLGLEFARRQLGELRQLVKERVRSRNIPWLDFEFGDGQE
ncbi:MAG: hypothetical protein AAB505_00505 [Patescibacteria group bacterium]